MCVRVAGEEGSLVHGVVVDGVLEGVIQSTGWVTTFHTLY